MTGVVQARGLGYEVVSVGEPWDGEPATPVVFVHGLGLRRDVWRPWYRSVLQVMPVAAAIDLRGHGESAAAWGSAPPTLEEYAGDVLAVIDDLGTERCHLVGESFGGTVCLAVASARPDRVASVTTLCTGFRGDRLHAIAHWATLPLEPEGHTRWSEEMIAGRFGADVSEPVRRWVQERHDGVPPHVVAGLISCLLSVDLSDDLHRIECPALVMAPARSPFVDTRQAETLRDSVAGAELVLLKDARHGAVITHHEQCATTLSSFLSRRTGT